MENNEKKEETLIMEKAEENTTVVEEESNEKKPKKSDNKIILSIAMVVVLLGLIGGSLFLWQNQTKNNTITNNAKEVKSEYRMSGNTLEKFDLYFLQLENSSKNLIYSPLSIKYALEMLGEGSKGTTKKQIDAVIGDYQAKKYTNNEHMSFANAMFIRNSYKENIKDSYTNILSDKYNAEIIYDPFENANTINSWIGNKTFNLINNLLDDDTVREENFILVNALGIDMEWNNLIQCATSRKINCINYHVNYNHENYSENIFPIEGERYSSITFNGKENIKAVEIGASINNYDIVKTLGEENIRKEVTAAYEEHMKQNPDDDCSKDFDLDRYIQELDSNYKRVDTSTDFYLYDDEEVKVFAKDLKEYDGTTLQYVSIMPKNMDLASYVKDTNPEKLNKIMNSLKEIKLENFKEGVVTKVTGYIPLFKFDYKLDFINDLKKIGITDVFDITKANLSGMLAEGQKQFINDASHKATIEFSNEGIKAAAVTQEGGAGATSCGFEYKYDVPVETIDLTFDNPYLFLIRDKNTSEVWFVGTVYEPVLNQ